MENTKERVMIVAVQTTQSDEQFQYALEEMKQLVDTAQGEVVVTVTQKRETYSGRTMIGKGKVEEISHLVDELEIDLIVFYQSLTGSQTKNLNETINARIIDRVQLILDIFAMRARSKEGKLQVQLAQLNYLLPRLSGQREGLSRQGGGIGTRGPGETRLETDRRYIRKQIQDNEEQLEQIKKHRERSREKRKSSNGFQLGLIGYTNAGKSTILNQLTQAGTYQMDQLFATLDPLTRQVDLFPNFEVTLTDTVGFIQEYAKFYTLDGELIDWSDTYGVLDTTPSNAGSYRHKENFQPKLYPLGYINLSEEYDAFVLKTSHIDLIFIDIFVFNKEGNIKSFVSVFEIDPLRDCEKTWEDFVYNYKVDTFFFQSRIQKNRIIKRTEKRFGMTIKTEWQLQKDGYFKVIKLQKKGKNEWLED